MRPGSVLARWDSFIHFLHIKHDPRVNLAVSPRLLLLPESEGCFQGAVTCADAVEQQSSTAAGLHVPPSGVGHQHRLLQPLDGPAVNLCFLPAVHQTESSVWSQFVQRLSFEPPVARRLRLNASRVCNACCVGQVASIYATELPIFCTGQRLNGAALLIEGRLSGGCIISCETSLVCQSHTVLL